MDSYRKYLRFLPKYYKTYYENNMIQFKIDINEYTSYFRIGLKSIFLISSFYYLDRKYFRFGEASLKTPNILLFSLNMNNLHFTKQNQNQISRIHPCHPTLPMYDIPHVSDYDEFEVFKEFELRLKEATRGNTIRYTMRYQDNPKLEEGRLIDEIFFESDYIRYRDLSRFQAQKQMQMVGFKNLKNENEANMRRYQFSNFKSKIKPVVE